jgi:hypothetical protein
MTVLDTSEIIAFEDEINNKIPIPKRWKEHILDEFKEQVQELDSLEELRQLMVRWAWITRPQNWLWETINMFELFPATTPYLLAINYLFEKGIESEHFSKKEEKKMASRFRRAIHRLYSVGILNPIHIEPEEVGPGRRSVTIWLSPFAKDKDFKKTREFYLAMGGIVGKVGKPKKKTPKDVAEHDFKVRAYHTLHKYTQNPQMYEFFKCPKKHTTGLKRAVKVTNRYKKSKQSFECPQCGRKMIETPYEDFIQLKEKALLNPEAKKL